MTEKKKNKGLFDSIRKRIKKVEHSVKKALGLVTNVRLRLSVGDYKGQSFDIIADMVVSIDQYHTKDVEEWTYKMVDVLVHSLLRNNQRGMASMIRNSSTIGLEVEDVKQREHNFKIVKFDVRGKDMLKLMTHKRGQDAEDS